MLACKGQPRRTHVLIRVCAIPVTTSVSLACSSFADRLHSHSIFAGVRSAEYSKLLVLGSTSTGSMSANETVARPHGDTAGDRAVVCNNSHSECEPRCHRILSCQLSRTPVTTGFTINIFVDTEIFRVLASFSFHHTQPYNINSRQKTKQQSWFNSQSTAILSTWPVA